MIAGDPHEGLVVLRRKKAVPVIVFAGVPASGHRHGYAIAEHKFVVFSGKKKEPKPKLWRFPGAKNCPSLQKLAIFVFHWL